MVPASPAGATSWQQAVPQAALPHDHAGTAGASPDAVYETALKTCLQLIA